MTSSTTCIYGPTRVIDNTLPTLTQQVVSMGRLSFAAFEEITMSAKSSVPPVSSAKP